MSDTMYILFQLLQQLQKVYYSAVMYKALPYEMGLNSTSHPRIPVKNTAIKKKKKELVFEREESEKKKTAQLPDLVQSPVLKGIGGPETTSTVHRSMELPLSWDNVTAVLHGKCLPLPRRKRRLPFLICKPPSFGMTCHMSSGGGAECSSKVRCTAARASCGLTVARRAEVAR